ncbi:hypothetical protein [Cohnella rhizosphaerae]|uniref:Uncharacterized protein n=1 Tax=Cohnella rhizosphaerae TaxID=1457232 RepID=A0A9X4KZU4_9BACL|nr:hypothetical protein [Cohnella rhizosphaerae]MDG0813962.1 hypothetical protein [Cohnella rhizosphaerae]
MMIALRREVCWLLILALLCAWLPAVSRAEVSAIQVEGESVNGANFTPSIQLGTAYSGGKYLALFTDTQAPSEGYLMPYQFQAPAAGLYQLDVATTPPRSELDVAVRYPDQRRGVRTCPGGPWNTAS